MPIEQAQRIWRQDPSKAGGGVAHAFRGRLDETAAFLAPVVLIVGLALGGGGFEVTSRHIAGLGAWLVVVALLALGAASRVVIGRPLYWSVGLIGGLALLSAISSLWSGSLELSVIEADRVLVYLSFFLAAYVIAQTDRTRQRFAEGLAISFTVVAVLGLGSRLLPQVIEVSNSLGTGPRLRYPLGYWNANGAMFGVATAMLLWMSRRSTWPGLRWVSVGAMPAVLLALYFTYSRGGLLSLVVASGLLVALSADRLWLLATLGAAALGTLPAVIAVQARTGLADNLAEPATIDQGVTVLLILLAGIALTVLLYAGLRWAERRGGRRTGLAVELSRNPKLLRGVALALALIAIGVVVAVGGKAWSQFSSSDIAFPADPSQHFSDLSGAGRHDFWRVALDAFSEDPILGHGAGTYVFSWTQLRSITAPVHDAHSLYLEPLAELGIVGGALVLALVLALLWFGFAAWRDSRGASRDRNAVLLAAMLSFAVGAAFDWFWEIADMGAIFFLAGGVLVGVRCAQLAPSADLDLDGDRRENRRFGLAVASVAVAWIAAAALIGPLLVSREIKASQNAAASGDIASAVDHAKTARSIEPWAASPYVQLGLLAELQEDYPGAVLAYTDAIEREDRNWQWYYLRAKAEREADETAAAEADLAKARELNPLAACLNNGAECG
jgi:O-antigen ligase